MKKCLKILLVGKVPTKLLPIIQKEAKSLGLEGVAQVDKDGGVKIVVCGDKEDPDEIIDLLHVELAKLKLDIVLEVEPFLRDKDYRGVFRIIE